MSPTERKALINAGRTDLSLTKQCKLLKISRSSLYYTPVGVNAETLKLMNEIDRVFTKKPIFPFRDHAAHNPAGQRIIIFIERLWRSLKQEAVYLHESQGGFQAKRVIKDWLSFYNTERPHTALDKQTPEDAFFDTERSQKAA